jgi:hypothetical protein
VPSADHRVAKGWIRRTGPALPDERTFQSAIDLGRAGAEAPVPLRLPRAREGRDRVGRRIDVGEEIQPLVPAPGMARQEIGPCQRDPVGKVRAAFVEQGLENPTHRQDGRSRLDGPGTDWDCAHLAAGHRSSLEDERVEAGMGEPQRGREPADARSNHDDASVRHDRLAFRPSSALICGTVSVNKK